MTKKSTCRSRARDQRELGAATDGDGFVRVEVDGRPALLRPVEPELVAGPPGLVSDARTAAASPWNVGIVGVKKPQSRHSVIDPA
jgi:hypothetical protein